MSKPLSFILIVFATATTAMAAHPVIPGLARPGLDPAIRGLVTLGELNCASCHAPGNSFSTINTKMAPDLSHVGSRANPSHIRLFLADPQKAKPGTTMPHVLGSITDPAKRTAAAEALTHYLVSIDQDSFSTQPTDAEAISAGNKLFHSIGCVACHAPSDTRPGTRLPTGSVPLGKLEIKYSVNSLASFLQTPHDVRPSGRMPNLHLSHTEAYQIANYLVRDQKLSDPLKVNVQKATEGKALFRSLNCTACHSIPNTGPAKAAAPLAQLKPNNGCMSDKPGIWPAYDLSEIQKKDIAAALAKPNIKLTTEQHVRKSLATYNCIACHSRGKWGGPAKDRNTFFQSADPHLGEPGRLPPPLTGVGAKLQPKWLTRTIGHGLSIRPYMKTRMPAFGQKAADKLVPLLGEADQLPAVAFAPLPKDRKKQREIKMIGHKLVGDKGMNCIACHTFRSQKVGAMAAVDIADSTTSRLKKDWFYHYMLEPARFRSATIMPQFFPKGVSIRKDVAGGDAKQQLDAIWQYLLDGRNTREPNGFKQPPMEIVVKDEAVMLRRSARPAGKRGISVGYPLKLNLIFDAESIAMVETWRGRFIDTGGVWGRQGSGMVRVMERESILLGKGPAFALLDKPSTPWPAKSRRELGMEFKGYELDKKQRPTFLYTFADIQIRDKPMDIKDETRTFLRRTITLKSTKDKTIYFRVAVGTEIQSSRNASVIIGKKMPLHISTQSKFPLTVRPSTVPKQTEVLLPIQIRNGTASVNLEYHWPEAAK